MKIELIQLNGKKWKIRNCWESFFFSFWHGQNDDIFWFFFTISTQLNQNSLQRVKSSVILFYRQNLTPSSSEHVCWWIFIKNWIFNAKGLENDPWLALKSSLILWGRVWTTERLSKICSRKTRFIQFNSLILHCIRLWPIRDFWHQWDKISKKMFSIFHEPQNRIRINIWCFFFVVILCGKLKIEP